MLTEGRMIGERYEIIGRVGSGGMADVYKATDHRLNRSVAVKVLKNEYSSDKNFVTKFRGEAQAAAGLQHPNVVNVYDVGEDNGLYYIVMELVEGITLKKFIERKGKLEIKEAIGIAIQIAQGMEAAHDNHIIHRDIKPQNIIISREGKVKVTDFGIAKAATSNTITTGAMGSVHYISPEAARGGYSDEKSDIYSLGVTLYEMLSGTMPFAADNSVSVALLQIQEEAIPLRTVDPNIPVSIEKIVQKCMQKKPERRYLTASELIKDLKRSLQDPDGEFVVLAPNVNDSPTINLSETEINQIKNNVRNVPLDTSSTGGREILDEDDDDSIDPKIERYLALGGILAIAILAGLIIFILVKGFNLFKAGADPSGSKTPDTEITDTDKPGDDTENDQTGSNPENIIDDNKEYPMPDITGKSLSDAVKMLEEAGITSYKYDYTFSETVEKDTVISTEPVSGMIVKGNQEVTIVVSNGETVLTIPDVYNRVQEEAETILTDNGFVVMHDYAYNDLEAGRVIETSPERNTEARKGDSVTIVISRGPETVMTLVPTVLGYTEAEATQILKDAGLEASVSHVFSDSVEAGKVVTQDALGGTEIKEGSAVGIAISDGPEPKKYSYTGSVVIDSPFDDGEEEAHIRITLQQPNFEEKTLVDAQLSPYDFPYAINGITGDSADTGYVYVYKDGVMYDRYWTVEFITVEE
jgi:serine/threonine-protein kinase